MGQVCQALGILVGPGTTVTHLHQLNPRLLPLERSMWGPGPTGPSRRWGTTSKKGPPGHTQRDEECLAIRKEGAIWRKREFQG